MELQHIKHIEEAVEKHATWTTKKLVFKVDAAVGVTTLIDVIPYLLGCSGGPKLGETLSFPHPPLVTQKELIGGFKREAAAQGVHLTQSASSSNIEARGGRFFKLACDRYRLYYPTADTTKKRAADMTNLDSTVPSPLYQTGVKMGTIRYSKKSRGKEGKTMVRRTETSKARTSEQRCPFNFTFRYNKQTDCWSLKGGTGCASHGFHAGKTKACLGLKTGELSAEAKKDIAGYAEASGNPRITRKIMKFKSGIELTHDQIHYIRKTVKTSEVDGPGSSADQLLTYLRGRPDISLYCVYDQYNTNLLAARNKGRPSKKEEAEKMKDHEVCQMVRLSEFQRTQAGENPSTSEEEVHTALTGIDTDTIFLDALEVREALRVKNED
jgi:hypothetical protein